MKLHFIKERTMSDNPYESPQAEVNELSPLSGRTLTENMLFHLRGASPWLRFVGIAGFILLTVLIILILAIMIGVGSLRDLPGMESFNPSLLIVYLPALAIGFFSALFTFRFGKKIQSYLQTGETRDLEEAFQNNKSLWTLTGVMYIITLAGFGLALLFGIIAAVFAFV
jgi:hypothetical protein